MNDDLGAVFKINPQVKLSEADADKLLRLARKRCENLPRKTEKESQEYFYQVAKVIHQYKLRHSRLVKLAQMAIDSVPDSAPGDDGVYQMIMRASRGKHDNH